MGYIKYIAFLLLVPVVTYGQTIHIDSNRIVYSGNVKLNHINKDELYERAKNAILNDVKGSRETIVTDSRAKGMISAKGNIKLTSPYHIIKTVEYILELLLDDGSYKYRIDSVYLKQVERGGKTNKISSEEFLKGMDMSGAVAANTEKQLNEIDMNFQKLLELVNADMKKTSVANTRNN
jgi:vacuolar-type H+-ATPase subunit E/Vma4